MQLKKTVHNKKNILLDTVKEFNSVLLQIYHLCRSPVTTRKRRNQKEKKKKENNKKRKVLFVRRIITTLF